MIYTILYEDPVHVRFDKFCIRGYKLIARGVRGPLNRTGFAFIEEWPFKAKGYNELIHAVTRDGNCATSRVNGHRVIFWTHEASKVKYLKGWSSDYLLTLRR